jgi:hypothetical protein
MGWRRLRPVCFLAEIHDAIGTLGEAFAYDLLRRSVMGGGDRQLGDLFWSFVDSNFFFCGVVVVVVVVVVGVREWRGQGGPGAGASVCVFSFLFFFRILIH